MFFSAKVSTKIKLIRNKNKNVTVNKKRDIFEKDLFRQAGEDLWRKVREVEQLDSKFALSSWQKVEERLKLPVKPLFYAYAI